MPKDKYIEMDPERKRRSRAKYACPSALQEIIKMLRLVPYNERAKFPNFDKEFQAYKYKLGEETEKISTLQLRLFLENLLALLPEEAQILIRNQLLFEDPKYAVELDDALGYTIQVIIQNYKNLYYLWTDVGRYINQRKERRADDDFAFGIHYQPIHAFVFYMSDGTEFLIGLAALIGKFDGNRLRICEMCSRVFWAKREESVTCSPPCSSTLRSRRHRERTEKTERTKS